MDSLQREFADAYNFKQNITQNVDCGTINSSVYIMLNAIFAACASMMCKVHYSIELDILKQIIYLTYHSLFSLALCWSKKQLAHPSCPHLLFL